MNVETVVEQAFEAILFGSTWYFGILLFFALTIGLLKAWKFAGVLIIPMIIALEVQYYNRLDESSGEFAWPMICLLILALATAANTIMSVKKD